MLIQAELAAAERGVRHAKRAERRKAAEVAALAHGVAPEIALDLPEALDPFAGRLEVTTWRRVCVGSKNATLRVFLVCVSIGVYRFCTGGWSFTVYLRLNFDEQHRCLFTAGHVRDKSSLRFRHDGNDGHIFVHLYTQKYRYTFSCLFFS